MGNAILDLLRDNKKTEQRVEEILDRRYSVLKIP
jgi:hypothetical protein